MMCPDCERLYRLDMYTGQCEVFATSCEDAVLQAMAHYGVDADSVIDVKEVF